LSPDERRDLANLMDLILKDDVHHKAD
jgi:hypothetical protein